MEVGFRHPSFSKVMPRTNDFWGIVQREWSNAPLVKYNVGCCIAQMVLLLCRTVLTYCGISHRAILLGTHANHRSRRTHAKLAAGAWGRVLAFFAIDRYRDRYSDCPRARRAHDRKPQAGRRCGRHANDVRGARGFATRVSLGGRRHTMVAVSGVRVARAGRVGRSSGANPSAPNNV
jgi:hypothetical protein